MHAWVPGCIHRVVVLFVVVASMKRVVIGCWMLLTEDGHGVVCVLTDDSALDMDDCFVGIRLSGQPPHCSTMGVRPPSLYYSTMSFTPFCWVHVCWGRFVAGGSVIYLTGARGSQEPRASAGPRRVKFEEIV